jgi:hypothetical protein
MSILMPGPTKDIQCHSRLLKTDPAAPSDERRQQTEPPSFAQLQQGPAKDGGAEDQPDETHNLQAPPAANEKPQQSLQNLPAVEGVDGNQVKNQQGKVHPKNDES